ncbi:MAG: hypothetical protein GQ477_03000 [Nanohaloarchaea archaeon]|nr:hypothetical protein [Candidatus Nanohaloarchaea archaeon]
MDGYNQMHDKREKFVPMEISKDGTKIMTEYLKNKKKKIYALDYGCGSKGSYEIPSNVIYEGFDIDKENKFAKHHERAKIKQKYDVITCCEVFEHMTVKEVKDTLKWMKKHSDIVILKIPIINALNLGEMFCDSTHIITSWTFLYSKDFLYDLEKKAGFEIEKYYFCTPISKNPIKTTIQKIISWACNTTRFCEMILILKTKQ